MKRRVLFSVSIPFTGKLNTLLLLVGIIQFMAGHVMAQQKNDAAILSVQRNEKDNTTKLITFSAEANLKLQDAQIIFERYSGVSDPSTQIVLEHHTATKTETVVDRYAQYYKGIKIELSSFAIMAKNDKVTFASANVFHVPQGSSGVPLLSEAGALAKALDHIGAQQYKWEDTAAENFLKTSRNNASLTYFPKGELVWIEDMMIPEEQRNRQLHLAYRFNIYAAQPMSRDLIYVDALTGKILQVSPQIQTVTATASTSMYNGALSFETYLLTGTYYLIDPTRGALIYTYHMHGGTSSGAQITNATTTWPKDTSIDAHWASEKIYDYWSGVQGRAGWDNANSTFYNYTHYGVNYNNAFWDGLEMVYGDGSGSATGFDPLVSLDVCAHELGHAVCQETAGLVYSLESGAMNEGFSDCWGAIIENYANPFESDAVAKQMWYIGEEIDAGNPLRRMDNPNLKNQPDTYGGTWWFNVSSCTPGTANDYCGVHQNSGVFNYWFYLLTNGGSGTNDVGNAFSVTGVGATKAANILYNTELVLSSTADYATMRATSITVATTLYGSCAPEVIAVTKAWYAVNVGANFTSTVPSAITGTASVCVGATTALSSSPTGGAWTTSASGVATVGTTGTVSGVSAGNANITYTITGCYVTKNVTVNTQPTAVTGTASVCVGSTTTLNSTPSGGTWTSSNTSLATVGGTTGVVTGASSGNPVITYTLPGGCFATRTATVNTQPTAITGTASVCAGSTTTLNSTPSGGTWTSSNTAVGTVSTGGVVTGLSAGNTNITYTLTGGCFVAQQVTVNTTPTAITGTASVCVGSTTTLNSTPSGGTWTSSNTSLATVGGTTGVVTGASFGNPVITYTLPGGCFATRTATVNTQPTAITGTASVCAGSTTTLNSTPSGGTWTSSNTAVGTVSTGGVVTGLSAGNTNITYTLTGGCFVAQQVTVNTTPTAITGTASVCVGSTTTLNSTPSGGTWTSSNTSLATVGGTTGVVTGASSGNPVITYTLPGGCFATRTATVNTQPTAITGTASVCAGSTTTLNSTPSGGTWTSSSTAVGTVSTGGVVTGIASGNTNITYTLTGGCFVAQQVTVNTTPTAITGTASVCVGSTTTLNSTPSGGTWTSSNASMATVGASTGVVTGVASGNPVITYTLSSGCFTTRTVTVNTQPSAISGAPNVCVGLTTTLSSSPTGGTWTSSNTAAGTVSTSGVVTGIASGNTNITYTLTGGCFSAQVVTVNAQPAAITGTPSVCTGNTTNLSSTPAGGTWTSGAAGVAVVGSSTGIVTGVSAGTAGIYYTLPGNCATSVTVTVNNAPAAITGTPAMCVGATTTLSSATSGGTWTSSSPSVATVGSSSGIVAGSIAGAATITYTMSNGCYVTQGITVIATPSAISGTAGLCVGSSTALSSSPSGGTWSSSATGIAAVGTSGIVAGVSAGNADITYSLGGSCYVTRTVTVHTSVAPITGTLSVCNGSATTLSCSTPGGTWISFTPPVATINSSTGVVTSVSAGLTDITYSLGVGCQSVATFTVNTAPTAITGTQAVCVGSTTTLNSTPAGGTWSSGSTGIATVGTSGIVLGVSSGTAGITYTLTGGCFVATTVTVSAPPASITGILTVCEGATSTLSSAPGGGNWTSNAPAIASVAGSTGLVSGNTAGTATITYTIGSGCSVTAVVTVNTAPAAISGLSSLCVGAITPFSSSPSGGTWSSSASGIASVGTSGSVLGVASGTANITYTLGNGCYVTKQVTVSTAPGTIFGLKVICVGANSTLTSAPSGGTWTSSIPSIASVVPGTGLVSGLATGTATITYMLPGGCFATTGVTINASPSPITGTPTLCVGGSSTLSSGPSGGTWSSSNNSIAGVGSVTGTVSGVSGGTAVITYDMTGCFSTAGVTVNALPTITLGASPSVITGTTTANLPYSATTGSPSAYSITYGTGALTAGFTNVTAALLSSSPIVLTVPGSAPVAVYTGTLTVTNGTCNSSNYPFTVTVTSGVNTPPAFSGGTPQYATVCSFPVLNPLNTLLEINDPDVGNTETWTIIAPPSHGTIVSGGTQLSTGSVLQPTGFTYQGAYGYLGSDAFTVQVSDGAGGTALTTINVAVNPVPAIVSVIGGGGYCAGGSGVNVGLTGSAVGVNYQLYRGGVPVGSPVPGVGTTLSFGLQTAAGNYTVTASAATAPCTQTMAGSVNVYIYALPNTYTVTGGGMYCPGGSGFVVGLSGSQIGATYRLYRGTTPVGLAIAGTGVPINFGPQTVAGTYTVVATMSGFSACTANMSGSATIGLYTPPTAYTVTGGGAYCVGGTGVSIGLSGSDVSVSYQLYIGSAAIGAPLTGTGSALSFGLLTAVGTYSVRATDPATGCIANMSGSVSVSTRTLPYAFTVTGGGSYCAGGAGVLVGLSGTVFGVNYQLYRGATPVGAPVAGLGASISFGLQTVAGIYTVVGTSATTGCSNNMMGSASVLVIALPAAYTVTGGGSICAGAAGLHVGLSNSDVGTSYQLYRGSTPVGSAVAGTGAALDFGVFTTVGVYTVSAYVTGTACTAAMSGSVSISINPLPTAYAVSGGGAYCTGGAGVHIYLSSSSAGVDYQLYLGTTPVGSPVAGTGITLDFGLITAVGTYTVVATNTTTGCVQNMTGSATVSVTSAPVAYTVTGGGSYCAGGTGLPVGLTGSQVGISYRLYVGATPVGSPVPGTGAAISFGLFSTAGVYTVVASTTGGCTTNMTGSVTISITTLPNAYTVTGGGSYCSGGSGVLVDLSGSDVGVNYQLYRGTSTVGTPVAGTGSALSFGLQTLAGTYTVVATNATAGCVRTMSGSTTVSISSGPAIVSMTGGGAYCMGGSGVAVGLAASAIGVNYQLYRGGTPVGSPVAGVGAALSFGLQTVAGVYTAVGTYATSACSSNMSGSATVYVNPVPTVYSVTGGGSYCAGGSGVVIGLSGSSVGITYKLLRSGTPVTSMPGTGSPLNFGSYTIAGTYTVIASSGTGCISTMSGSAMVTVNPVPTVTGSIYTMMPAASITLIGSVSGGSWSSSNTAVATVGSSTGIVTGMSLGTATITYTLPTGCFGVRNIAVTVTGFKGPGNVTTSAAINLTVLPNPNKGVFTVKGSLGTEDDTEVFMEVTDMLGRVLHHSTVNALGGEMDQSITLSNAANGMYLLRLKVGGENHVFHIVVEQ